VDLHTRTAAKIFGVPDDRASQDDSLHRLPAKTCNFSIIMGTTGIGLAEQMRKNQYPWPEIDLYLHMHDIKALYQAQAAVCDGWIKTIISDWGIQPYISEKHAQARRYGYVTDMWGRRRYLPSVLSPNKQIREGALRQAQSFGPQAGARGIYKQVVGRVWREVIRPLQQEGRHIEPLMDLHDDLLLEFESGLADLLKPLVKSYFEGTVEGLPIPILCSAKVGERWSQL
jgi:DNA polymerase-1